MKTVSVYTLGCKLNFAESSALARQFREAGFGTAAFDEGADIYIINTCSVTEHADRKCKKVVREALRHNPGAFIAIVGCYAQLKPHEIATIPGVDVVLGAAEKFRMLELAQGWEKRPKALVHQTPIGEVRAFMPAFSLEERTRAFLKIQDGCDYKCTFCTIPQARGSSRSQAPDEVLRQIDALACVGVKEVVLTGVNLGDYGRDVGASFFDLLQIIENHGTSIGRFRISSIEPNLLSNDIVHLVAGSQRFMPHFHIPLQSGSDKTLARMRRRYKRELFASRIGRIRSLMPHAAIGVDVIVGFPGESDADFLDTLRFLADLEVSYLHVFPFSARANTPAATMQNQVPEQARAERTAQLRNLSEKFKRAFYETHLQTVRPVLFEEPRNPDQMLGWSDNYIRVCAPYDPLLVAEVAPMQFQEIGAEGNVRASACDYMPPPVALRAAELPGAHFNLATV